MIYGNRYKTPVSSNSIMVHSSAVVYWQPKDVVSNAVCTVHVLQIEELTVGMRVIFISLATDTPDFIHTLSYLLDYKLDNYTKHEFTLKPMSNHDSNQCFPTVYTTLCWKNLGWPLSSHDQLPDFSPTFQVNIYTVSTLATASIQNEMHVIFHSNIHIY